MKKIYSLLTLMLLAAVSFAAKAQVAGVTISCASYSDKLVVRDGGPEGALIELDENGIAKVDLTGEMLYFTISDVNYTLASVQYNSYYSGTIRDNSCQLTTSLINPDSYVNVNITKAKTITLNVADPEVIVCRPGGEYKDDAELTAGANVFKLGQYDGLYIAVRNPQEYVLTRVYRVSDNKSYSIKAFKNCSLYSYDFNDNDVISYTAIPASEFEYPKFKVRVDHPETAKIFADNNSITLEPNEWKEIEMLSSTASLSIQHITYGQELYSVTRNGVEQTASYGYYNLTVAGGDEIDVKTDFPDEDYTITASVEPAEYASFITDVTLDDETIDWTQPLTVHCGKKLKFTFDNIVYNLKKILTNGTDVTPTNLYGTWEYKATSDANIVFEVEKKPVYTIKLNVKDPEAVDIRLNYNALTVKAGENIVEYTSDANSLLIAPAKGATVNHIDVVQNGKTTTYTSSSTLSLYLDQSYESIDIDIDPMVRDKRFVLYLGLDEFTYDESSGTCAPYYYIMFNNELDSSSKPVCHGYNEVEFAEAEKNFSVSFYPPNSPVAYQNGETFEPAYNNGPFHFVAADGDVVKIFDNRIPESYNATFNILASQAFTAKKDRITELTEFDNALTELEGTEICFIPEDNHALKVFVKEDPQIMPNDLGGVANSDGTAVEPNEDGNFVVVLDGNKQITVKDETANAIDNVLATDPETNTDVYTVAGALVLRNASAAQLKALPAGIYIVGGAKYVQK